MRFKFSAILAFIAAFIALALLPGCAWLESGGLVRHTPTVVRAGATNYVERLVTNYVGVTAYITNLVTVQAAGTNALGAYQPAVVQPQLIPTTTMLPVIRTNLEVQILPAVVVDQLSLAPAVSGGVSLAGQLAPVPWASGAAEIALALAGSVFAFVNHRKAKAALGERDTWQNVAKVGVLGVESIRKAALQLPGYTPEIDARVMGGLIGMQRAAGIKAEVEDLVARNTGKTLG